MATVSGKIYQVKDGTTNLFPRTVIEAVYGLDKTIADVKTWVGGNYVTIATAQTISALKTMTAGLKVSGRVQSGGDDEGIVVDFAANGYAALTLGNPSGRRSVFYLTSSGNPFWRYHDGTSSYNISHPGKAGTIALTSDLSAYLTTSAAAGTYLPLSGGTMSLANYGSLTIKTTAQTSNLYSYVRYEGTNTSGENTSLGYLGFYGVDTPAFMDVAGHSYTLWHAGNFTPSNYLPLAGGTMTGDINLATNEKAIVLATATSWSNSDRAIPFSSYNDPSKITYYYNNADKGLTFNPTTGALKAGTFVKRGGTSSQFLKADGSTDSTAYLPLAAQGLTVYRTTSGQIANFNNSKGANEEAYLTLQSNSTSKAAVGWNSTYGTYIYNYPSAKYLGIKDDGTPHYHNNTIWHAGNANLSTVDWTAKSLNLTIGGNGIIYAGATYSILYQDSSYNSYLGTPDKATYIRSSSSLIHRQGSTDYTIYDSGNLNKSKIIDIMGTFPEAYLGWGGRNLTSSQIGPMDAALCDVLGANRFAFAKAAGIDITYSNDGGSTWTDYGASDATKLALTSSGTDLLIIGKSSSSSPATANSRLKVVFNTATCEVYTNLDKFIVRVSTVGSSSCWVSIRVRTQTNVEAGTDTWTTLANKVPIDGWSGYDVINVMKFTTYGNGSSKSHQGQIELIFGADGAASSTYYGLRVHSIYAYGGMGWTTPSTMAKTGHLYSYDYNQTAYFPNDVHPAASGKYLGSSSNRWNLYATEGDFSGIVSCVSIRTAYLADSSLAQYIIGSASDVLGSGYKGLALKSYGSESIYLFTGGSQRMVINSAGNVGIGSDASSSYKLYVNGASYINGTANITTTATVSGGVEIGHSNEINGVQSGAYTQNIHLNYRSTGYVSLCYGGGNVGIGTLSPSARLQIASPAYSYMNTRLSGHSICFDKLSTNTTGFHNAIIFRRLDASLNIVEQVNLIGTYSSDKYVCTYIAGTANTNSAIRIDGSGTSATVSVGYTGGGSYKLNVSGVIYSTTGIFSNGYVSALGTASSSDAKLKDDITTISYDRAKEVLFALNPREWTWNALTSKEGERGAGMVAQEVEPILPDTVKEIGGNLTLEYNTLFAYGLAMTKYLVPAVESLEERVARLERENEELKRQLTN